MIDLKKTVMAVAVFASMGATADQASADACICDISYSPYPMIGFGFAGQFTMRDTEGVYAVGNSVFGNMIFDITTGVGTANLAPNPGQTFYGYTWTAHNINLQATGANTVHVDMLFDWLDLPNISFSMDLSMTPTNWSPLGFPYRYTVTTMDSNGDNIPGIPTNAPPFLYWSAAFDGVLTLEQSSTPTLVPIPAAAWLLGSGLVGLGSLARKRKTR